MKTKTAAKPKTKTSDKTNKILVNVVLDRSGSMGSARMETISGFNVYIDKLREDKKTKYDITLTQFDLHQGPELTVTYSETPLADVKPLTVADYEPRGGTPLYDAIIECIRRVTPDDKGRANIMVVITDGEENSSSPENKDGKTVRALIKQKESEGWTFVFLGSDIDAYKVGGAMGSSVGNTSNYNKALTNQMFAASAGATMTRSALYANHGMNAVASSQPAFFTDTQKAAMGDTPVTPAINIPSVWLNPPSQQVPQAGGFTVTNVAPVGSSAAQANFRTTDVSKP